MKDITGTTTIYVGWKSIAKRLGVKDPRTARSLVRRYCIPVYRIGKSPRLDESIYRLWVAAFVRRSAEEVLKKPSRDNVRVFQAEGGEG